MLALHGGEPENSKTFSWHSTIDERDEAAVVEVMRSKQLSGFYGSPGPAFLGGPKVKEFDRLWAEYFEVNTAVSMNSASSCLYAAVGALGIGPGDEVIVPPLSMAVSAVCVLAYGAIPIFADVEEEYACIDAQSIREKVTAKTKAIIVVNLFGGLANWKDIHIVAKEHNLKIIEDNAQAPGALYNGQMAGTLGDIGIFSLNCHKVIQTGEGGVAVTNDEKLGRKLQLIRNHAESVVTEEDDLNNMLGWNYRLTELQAAIGIVQLSKLKRENERKEELAASFDNELSQYEFLSLPKVRSQCTHAYYLYMIRYHEDVLGVPRESFIEALNAEGFSVKGGYVRPIYRIPLFQKQIAIGNSGWPFHTPEVSEQKRYEGALCPVAERLHQKQFLCPDLIRYDIEKTDIECFSRAIGKVASHASHLSTKK